MKTHIDRKAHGVGIVGQVQRRKEMDKSGKGISDIIRGFIKMHYIPKIFYILVYNLSYLIFHSLIF